MTNVDFLSVQVFSFWMMLWAAVSRVPSNHHQIHHGHLRRCWWMSRRLFCYFRAIDLRSQRSLPTLLLPCFPWCAFVSLCSDEFWSRAQRFVWPASTNVMQRHLDPLRICRLHVYFYIFRKDVKNGTFKLSCETFFFFFSTFYTSRQLQPDSICECNYGENAAHWSWKVKQCGHRQWMPIA